MNTCFVDCRITEKEFNILNKENLNIIKIPKSPYLYDSICAHPDIQVNISSNNEIVIAKNSLLNINLLKNFKTYYSNKNLENKYPKNIFLNAINLEKYFIHNLKYTDSVLLEQNKTKELINIKQGYSKCSCAIVNDNALITSDLGIYNTLSKYPIDLLLIPSGDITLKSLPYGFIGGSCGLIAEDKMAFFGNLSKHSYGEDIKNFLFKHNVKPIYLSESKLIDRGSLLTIF